MKNSYNTWFFCVLFLFLPFFIQSRMCSLVFTPKSLVFMHLHPPINWGSHWCWHDAFHSKPQYEAHRQANLAKEETAWNNNTITNLSWVLRPSPVALLINHMLAKLGEVVCIYYYPTVHPNHSTGMMTNDQPETVIFFCGKTCSSANQEPLKFRVFSGFPSWLKRSFLICTAITQKTYGSLQFHNHPGSPKSDQKFTVFLWNKIAEVVCNLDIFNPGPAGKIGIWNDLDG